MRHFPAWTNWILLMLAMPLLLLAVACGDPAAIGLGPTPTSTPTLPPPSRGIHTPEDLREHLASVPEAWKLVFDEDIVIEFRPAWWESYIGDWIDAAAIYHITTMSRISLDGEGG